MSVNSCYIPAASEYVFTHALKYQSLHKNITSMFWVEGGNVFHLNAGPYLQISNQENRQ
jgi:hypothetical protein